MLGVGLALLQQLLHQCLVVQCRLQVGLALQGLLVGIQGGIQFAGTGQGIASIVVRRGAVALGECLGRASVVACLVQRHAAPLWILEALGGFGGTLVLQQVLALLIGATPEVLEFERLAWLGQGK